MLYCKNQLGSCYSAITGFLEELFVRLFFLKTSCQCYLCYEFAVLVPDQDITRNNNFDNKELFGGHFHWLFASILCKYQDN